MQNTHTMKQKSHFKETKDALEKAHNRTFSDSEVDQAICDLQTLAEITLNLMQKEQYLKQKLEENPKGFHHEEGGTCEICGELAKGEHSWFDKFGLKCTICQNGIKKRVIPGSIAKSKDSWYTRQELRSAFNLQGKLLKELIKSSLLKVRQIRNESNKIHLELYLIKDNKNMLPPKKLIKPRVATIEKDGKTYHTMEEWYEYADERLYSKIAQYEISQYFPQTFAEPIDQSRLLVPAINPLFGFQE